ncbi:hypothetical protein CF394_13980 [Tetzosporium hominis]|uniref:Glycosyl transferase family 1 n=1 Tax=Tetzosporium hominis TaxID=2020506 RepID=A0A264W084_9BACL|nr:glycosyltransferase [Tetzosporium hominis]OZS76955.1 hypothetical protein CF394_13980 [Tetzosporium hominis]
MEKDTNKPKVMLHYILPPNTSGPNVSMERIENSWLKNYYYFGNLIQDERPGKTFNIRLLKKMIFQIKTFNPDIIHISGLQSAGLYAVLAARIAGCKKVITTVHGSSVDAIGFHPFLKLLYQTIIEPLTIRLSSRFYTVCYDMSNKFGLNEKSNFSGVIHNPVPIINEEKHRKNDFRNEIGINDKSMVVTYVGRMTYDKGLSYAIESVKQIKNKNIVFLFVGDGPYTTILKNELRKEIEDERVYILGKRNDVLKIMIASDVFLFPTLHENLSNALLEACAVGLAIVSTSVGGNKEVIINEENGLLIPPRDSEAIITAINRLYKNKDEREDFSMMAQKNVYEKFSQEKIYAMLKDLYDKTLHKEKY